MDSENLVKADRKSTLFEEVISRLVKIESNQHALACRSHEKTIRINNTGSPINSKLEERPESVINILHNIMDRMEQNNQIMEMVVQDLENSIM